MDEKLRAKCDLLAENYLITQNSAKLDWSQAAGLGALIYTNMNITASESDIRSNRALLKKKVGAFNNLRGYTDLALLCKMSLKSNPEAYLDNVMAAYDNLRFGFFHSEYEALAASSVADFAEPSQYAAVGQKTSEILDVMQKQHPMLTGHEDVSVAALLAMSDMDVEAKLAEADACYEELKHDHFTFAKDALQSVSMILALSDTPVEEKCARFRALRSSLGDAGTHMFACQLPMLAAMVDTDVPVEQVAKDIDEAAKYLKKKKGFGDILGMGHRMRGVLASAIVLQTYQEQADVSAVNAAAGNAAASVVAQQIILAIIMTIIITSVVVSTTSANS